MSPRIYLCATILAVCPPALAQEEKKQPELSLNEVSLEINALEAFKQFDFSFAQMEQLQKWAKETAQKDQKREPAKTSKEYAEKLRQLHKALLDNDETAADQLYDEIDDLREKEKPAVDDGVDITDTARKRAVEAMRSLKPMQLAGYLGKIANDVPDPYERLTAALEEVRSLTGNEWKAKRDEIADEVSRLVAGLDPKKAEKVNDAVVALLIRAREMKDAQFKKQRPELEQTARKIIGNVTPFDMLRHQTELSLAELLSNPRLANALAARLK